MKIKIKTKYNVGDSVWYINADKIAIRVKVKAVIIDFRYYDKSDVPDISYLIGIGICSIAEKNIFKTKKGAENLIKKWQDQEPM